MRVRAGIILIKDGRLALIERLKQGQHYFAFPGGGVDAGESAEQAATREAKEELGLDVIITRKVAQVSRNGQQQVYFLAEQIGGEFGSGQGEEYGAYYPAHGTYQPLWMPLQDITVKNVVPRELAQIVALSAKAGWSSEPVIIVDDD